MSAPSFLNCILIPFTRRRRMRTRHRTTVDERLASDINDYERNDRAFDRPERFTGADDHYDPADDYNLEA